MILACNNITKSFGTDEVLAGVSFHINEREKAAIVGINGAGKSTLLKIIMNQLKQDDGEVILAKGATIGYLAQHQDLDSSNTIYEEMLEVKRYIIELDEKIRAMETEMKHASGDKLENLLNQYSKLTHEFEMNDGYAYKSEITGVLKGLGFDESEFDKRTNELSGGQKTRVSLGKLLLSKPDIILLDEPTNHLDLNSIAWLETYLINYPGAVLIVAHDRYFLDRVVTKIIELERTKARVYDGNYTDYMSKKAMIQEALLKQYQNQQREIKHQEEVIAKLRSFNREKSIKRAESRVKMLDKIERIDKPITEDAHMHFSLEPSVISGNDVLTVRDLGKSFGEHTLFTHLDFDIKRSEKVAIIGGNGTGKTTILKILNGILDADTGTVTLGSKVKIGYYDQEHQVLNMEKTLFDEVHDAYPYLDNTQIRNTLAAFLFTNDDVFKRVKDLSGGERGRLSLAKLMLSESNLLILDEPTNHLDIASKEILENAINNYTGTVLYVSHDRYFINKTATRILDLTNQTLIQYIGNYDYYLEKKEVQESVAFGQNGGAHMNGKNASAGGGTSASMQTAADSNVSDSKLDWKQQKEEQARQRKIQNQIKKCEDEISKLEERSAEIDELLAQADIYTNVNKLVKLNDEKKEIEEKLEELMEEWESLL